MPAMDPKPLPQPHFTYPADAWEDSNVLAAHGDAAYYLMSMEKLRLEQAIHDFPDDADTPFRTQALAWVESWIAGLVALRRGDDETPPATAN